MTSSLPLSAYKLLPDNNNNNPAAEYPSPDSANAPRSILPRPGKLAGPSTLDAGTGTGATPSRHAKRPRTNVTIACDGCKLARAKCDGKHPCMRCMKKALACKYDQGNDRRQNRGSNEEVQALTDRLGQYQKFVFALRSSSLGNASYALRRLRSPSTETEPQPRHQESCRCVADVAALTAAVELLNDTKSSGLVCMDVEETAALVGWIKRDMDMDLDVDRDRDLDMDPIVARTHRPSLSQSGPQSQFHPHCHSQSEKQQLPRELNRNGVAARSLPKTHFTVEGLLC
ncbi:hypothetical protein G647_03798 [Cladophialophora carrionii CBS 160.54]|uniref:Zn(2)-C6 fungal-type domain-containing protein n=1 Tax=Cladophialophora carrionii CBS 160.54 TaxID=1279043 RepID=V9DC13_9EURO|nr:uncharacterized protein G647_03798 [Cladophialophora carrionii CBS 160.54]ETI24429.1 hypothetical protein G647_03798 [Cladophialophora carrionii CBS 160.54]